MNAVELDRVGVRFGDVVVLGSCTLAIRAGRTHAIVGPSGSGKSTLLAVVGLLLQPTAGSVRLLGASAPTLEADRAKQRRELIRWVPQLPQLLPGRSAHENVAVAAEVAGLEPAEAWNVARVALERVGLGSRLRVPAARLSGGEQQRVSVARAIASRAPLVLADEPTASLDRTSAAEVVAALLADSSPRRTVIVATHDELLAAACDAQTDLRDLDRRP